MKLSGPISEVIKLCGRRDSIEEDFLVAKLAVISREADNCLLWRSGLSFAKKVLTLAATNAQDFLGTRFLGHRLSAPNLIS